MLSITGLSLEQFSALMQGGLGYKAEKGEREKVKKAPEAAESADAAVNVVQDAPDCRGRCGKA